MITIRKQVSWRYHKFLQDKATKKWQKEEEPYDMLTVFLVYRNLLDRIVQ